MDAAAAVAAVARQRCFGDIRVPEQALEAETVRLLWLLIREGRGEIDGEREEMIY